MKKIVIIILAVLIILGISAYLFKDQIQEYWFGAQKPTGEIGITKDKIDGGDSEKIDIEVVARGLSIPWEIAFLSNGEMLVTERPGNLLRIGKDKKVIPIDGVKHVGEGGLQGMALHPDFEDNNWIYLYFTTQTDAGLINRVERYVLSDDSLTDKIIIIDNIPGAQYHDGGRIEFGPDNKLYIATGDAGDADKAQDPEFLGGKILRINDDGSIPGDNPFGSAVYSYGHRNPQGLAWDSEGNLWSTEHGRSVPLSGYDELNLIKPGANYGWPDYQGDEVDEGITAPAIHSGPDYTWAPAGAVFYNGDILFSGLRGEAIYQYNISQDKLTTNFFEDFGRIRAIVLGPDNYLYISTSNTDGRGQKREGDDKIIRINLDLFE